MAKRTKQKEISRKKLLSGAAIKKWKRRRWSPYGGPSSGANTNEMAHRRTGNGQSKKERIVGPVTNVVNLNEPACLFGRLEEDETRRGRLPGSKKTSHWGGKVVKGRGRQPIIKSWTGETKRPRCGHQRRPPTASNEVSDLDAKFSNAMSEGKAAVRSQYRGINCPVTRPAEAPRRTKGTPEEKDCGSGEGRKRKR